MRNVEKSSSGECHDEGSDSYSGQVNDDLFQFSGHVPSQQQHPTYDVCTVSSFSSLSSSGHTTPNPLALITAPGIDKRRSKPENTKKHRKRKRPFLLRLTVSLKDAHLRRHPWDDHDVGCSHHPHDDNDDDPHQHAYDTPDFAHFFHLTAALLLCTVMAVLSALDAEQHCLQHEMYAVLQLVDDDAAVQAAYDTAVEHESDKCIPMLERVVLPTGGATALCAITVLILIFRYNRSTTASTTTTSDTESQSHNGEDGGASPRVVVPPQQWGSVVRMTVSLFFLFLVMLGLQTYNVTAVMLKPRADSTDDNPYQSLAAVDRFGHVGDNANLYYLAWLSEGLAIALVYQVATACFRVVRAARRQQADDFRKAAEAQYDPCAYANKQELLRATSWDRGTMSHRYRKSMTDQSRAAWYSSLYRLRLRTGMWTAACISCLIILASSQYIWRQVLWPFISSMVQHRSDETAFSYFSVCQTASQSTGNFSAQMCRRTLAAWFSGLVAAFLCATAIAMHLAARYSPTDKHPYAAAANSDGHTAAHYYDHDVVQLLTTEDLCPKTTSAWKNASPAALLSRYYSHHHPKRLPLRTELTLGVLLSILLGVNAVLVTGVQGPALKVGNLYYASWLSFLLCLRICLGCVEEFYNIDDEEDDEDGHATISADASAASGANVGNGNDQQHNDKAAYQAPELDGPTVPSNGSGTVTPTTSVALKDNAPLSDNSVTSTIEKQEKKRLGRVRGYFFLSIFSTVCAASSYDAASNQSKALSREQKYLMLAPCIVAAISYLLFGLCLSKKCYNTISKFWIGGLLSIVSFSLWFGDLLLTMHSDDSWAVNSIGEIAMANLYYFSWASIITSGIQMTSYIKALLGIQKLDYMSAVWVAICKVCFVILGASLHIWHTISDNCEFDEITLGAVTFCSRTILAITVSLTGMLVGGLVVLAVVALITGIGGPGQSVGDLYYSSWLAFWVSLNIFVTCYHQLNEEEKESEGQKCSTENVTSDKAQVEADSAIV